MMFCVFQCRWHRSEFISKSNQSITNHVGCMPFEATIGNHLCESQCGIIRVPSSCPSSICANTLEIKYGGANSQLSSAHENASLKLGAKTVKSAEAVQTNALQTNQWCAGPRTNLADKTPHYLTCSYLFSEDFDRNIV